jgi:hypothetical protein
MRFLTAPNPANFAKRFAFGFDSVLFNYSYLDTIVCCRAIIIGYCQFES